MGAASVSFTINRRPNVVVQLPRRPTSTCSEPSPLAAAETRVPTKRSRRRSVATARSVVASGIRRLGLRSLPCWLYFPDGTRATRKPSSLLRNPGSFALRFADRHCPAALPQLPPRTTRTEPSDDPSGSVPPRSTNEYESWHHSDTLPCMSVSPQGFTFFWPTKWA